MSTKILYTPNSKYIDFIPHQLSHFYTSQDSNSLHNRDRKSGFEKEINQILGHLVTESQLLHSCKIAKSWGVAVPQALISLEIITAEDYGIALARYFQLPFLHFAELKRPILTGQNSNSSKILKSAFYAEHKHGFDVLCLPSEHLTPDKLRQILYARSENSPPLCITTRKTARMSIEKSMEPALIREAVQGLNFRFPGESAGTRPNLRYYFLPTVLFVFLKLSFILQPVDTLIVAGIIFSVLFLAISWFRLLAAFRLSREGTYCRSFHPQTISDRFLPVYMILIPLFREKEMLLPILQAMQKLNYPKAKLDIKIILESNDKECLDAISNFRLPPIFEVITVPECHPQTKPKALNYALPFARGKYLVIYDAEDQPEPDQLRKAITMFRNCPDTVACLQAHLTFFNMSESWLTRQFSIEYNSLFDGLLPILQKLQIPIPLGGTSNHFDLEKLRAAGAWDAFNVTEDADLGLRLYRHGFEVRMLNSTTFEEATNGLVSWLKQRTRWLKGWMQTYTVQMRRPIRCTKELGLRGFTGLQILFAGIITSALLHPFVLGYLVWQLSWWSFNGYEMIQKEKFIWLLSLTNLLIAYLAAMLLGSIALLKRHAEISVLNVLFIPVYWLLISIAAYRALFQFFSNPFKWEKTEHGKTRFMARASQRTVLKLK